MIYYVQRLILNDNQWTQPSPGRLVTGEVKYVQGTGFGLEDWNFNYDLAVDGYIYGYTYYWPAKAKADEVFNFAFATYQAKQWYLVGYYKNCRYLPEGAPNNSEILKKKSEHLLQLKTSKSLGTNVKDQSPDGVLRFLKSEQKNLRWKVHVGDVVIMPFPVPIPKSIVHIRNFHIPRPTGVSEDVFNQLMILGLKEIPAQGDFEDTEFAEGREAEITHIRKERSPELVKAAKAQFLKTHGKLLCQVCGFDFVDRYGEVGHGFIEAHHTIPVKDLEENAKTKISDLALVCANCHRMLHRKRPWLKINSLKKLLDK